MHRKNRAVCRKVRRQSPGHVWEGKKSRKGENLITFDTAKIKAAGHPLVTMMVVTEDNGNENLAFENGKAVTAGDTKIATIG